MNEIFISYGREDRPTAERLATALTEHGWSVWWDRKIPVGKSFNNVIQEALDSAKCVIVIWSRNSVSSDFVKAEASDAKQRGILVPVLIDDARIPLEFRQLQTARLPDWQGDQSNPTFAHLMDAIARNVTGDATAKATGRIERRTPLRTTFRHKKVLIVIAGIIVTGLLAIPLVYNFSGPVVISPSPTPVVSPTEVSQIDMTKDVDVTASNTLPPQFFNGKKITYEPMNLIDQKAATAWAVKGGVGQWIRLAIKKAPLPPINRITITAGYEADQKRYTTNNRVKAVDVTCSDGWSKRLDFDEKDREKTLDLGGRRCAFIRLEILEIRRGTIYDDLAISGVYLQ